jgi:hypothetical protein
MNWIAAISIQSLALAVHAYRIGFRPEVSLDGRFYLGPFLCTWAGMQAKYANPCSAVVSTRVDCVIDDFNGFAYL